MRTHLLVITGLIWLAGMGNVSASESSKWTWGDHELGMYVNLTGRASSVLDQTSAFGDARIGLVFNDTWTVGLTGTALGHDNQLSELVDDGTYHLYTSYGGFFVERIFGLTQNMTASLMFMSGQGTAYYQYDKDYRKEKVWSEEIIDQTTFGVQELTLEVQHRVYGNFWMGVSGSVRNTSPIRLIGTSDGFLKKPSVGVSFKYNIM